MPHTRDLLQVLAAKVNLNRAAEQRFSQTAAVAKVNPISTRRKLSDDEEVQVLEITEREKLAVHTSIRRSVVLPNKRGLGSWSSQ